MDDFILFLKLGLYHVLDFQGYDHILFLVALAVIYNLKNWKKLIWLITLFTIGHTLTLTLSAYKVLNISIKMVEFLIPITILITALVNIFTAGNKNSDKTNTNLFFAFFFGLIHGLGFSNYFRMIIEDTDSKLLPLLEFAIGIEIAQVVIVSCILVAGIIAQRGFRVSIRDWVMVLSSIVIGFVIPMIKERIFW